MPSDPAASIMSKIWCSMGSSTNWSTTWHFFPEFKFLSSFSDPVVIGSSSLRHASTWKQIKHTVILPPKQSKPGYDNKKLLKSMKGHQLP